ncbi:alpha/beta hydrolase [Rhizobium leguminosarum]|uniref:alpha/beta fold hydrolase n=1 Tax=Rhizobium leguminosarum TaxID=384 RepID=UPI001C96C660|nr:alpha/beta hydrolase [Rhizobium leguminosarum]MBY5538242.1 alpha/beta hydrolase [Rhizobium leguminosarum]
MQTEINGTEIYFDILNSDPSAAPEARSKPTIIALHGGLGFDHRYLRPGIGPLSDVARIIFVDLRGQGQSARPALDTCSLEQMADDVAGLSAKLGIDRPIIFGHSAGGFVGMTMALRHPKLVSGLILSGTVATLTPSTNESEADPTLAKRAPLGVVSVAKHYFGTDVTETSAAAFFQEVGPYYGAPQNMEMIPRLLALSSVDVPMLRHFRKDIVPVYDLRAQLAKIACPTLVLVGSHDWVCPPRASRLIARAIPHSEFFEFDQSGHFLFSEEPQRFLSVARDFLSRTALA